MKKLIIADITEDQEREIRGIVAFKEPTANEKYGEWVGLNDDGAFFVLGKTSYLIQGYTIYLGFEFQLTATRRNEIRANASRPYHLETIPAEKLKLNDLVMFWDNPDNVNNFGFYVGKDKKGNHIFQTITQALDSDLEMMTFFYPEKSTYQVFRAGEK